MFASPGGMPVFTDDVRGDRITPTGAAILNHLSPDFSASLTGYSFGKTGVGFGTSRFKGISNMLRVSVYESTAKPAARSNSVIHETVAQIEFEVDDQSPEDLAVAVARLRSMSTVHDVIQRSAFGKKGRVVNQIQILAATESTDAVAAECFRQTTTLGVRVQTLQRQVLQREHGQESDNTDDGRGVRYKRAQRPDGAVTVKAEMDDIAANASNSHADRQALRRRIEDAAAQKQSTENPQQRLSGQSGKGKDESNAT